MRGEGGQGGGVPLHREDLDGGVRAVQGGGLLQAGRLCVSAGRWRDGGGADLRRGGGASHPHYFYQVV